jgi:hypothetical protein
MRDEMMVRERVIRTEGLEIAAEAFGDPGHWNQIVGAIAEHTNIGRQD